MGRFRTKFSDKIARPRVGINFEAASRNEFVEKFGKGQKRRWRSKRERCEREEERLSGRERRCEREEENGREEEVCVIVREGRLCLSERERKREC